MTKPATAPPPRIPLQVSSVDIRSLPIGPEEAFVWSRVDGAAGAHEISLSTGLDQTRVLAALDKLHGLGALRYPGESQQILVPLTSSSATTPDSEAPQAQSEPAPESPLGQVQERRVSDMLLAIDSQDHYQLLGIRRDASRAQIKEAYFALIGHFHPDRYFRQALGANKAKLERVFKKLTEAHETLTRKKLREQYDAQLPPEPDAAPDAQVESASQVRRTTPPQQTTLRSPVLAANAEQTAAPAPSPAISQTWPTPKPLSDNLASGVSDPEVRRRVLARKLFASPPPRSSEARSTASAPGLTDHTRKPASSAQTPAVNLRGLRPMATVDRYLAAAAQAEAEGNVIAVANSLRLALAVQPDDPVLSQRLRAAEEQADTALADKHLAQAQSHEANHDYEKASRLYARAARGKSSSELFRRAAECCLKMENGLRQAGEYAKSAVQFSPENPDLRLLLGKIYAQAGMRVSSLSELDKASQLSPGDDTIKSWLKRVKAGDV